MTDNVTSLCNKASKRFRFKLDAHGMRPVRFFWRMRLIS